MMNDLQFPPEIQQRQELQLRLHPQRQAVPSQRQPRSDSRSSAIVERGIIVQSTLNTVCAIEYLRSHNVQSQIIERVLLHPEQRRPISH